MSSTKHIHPTTTEYTVRHDTTTILQGDLTLPSDPTSGICVFAHGSGSSRFSPRNRYVASIFHQNGIGTLLMDLLTPDEEVVDNVTRGLRFNIRKFTVTHWQIYCFYFINIHKISSIIDLPSRYCTRPTFQRPPHIILHSRHIRCKHGRSSSHLGRRTTTPKSQNSHFSRRKTGFGSKRRLTECSYAYVFLCWEIGLWGYSVESVWDYCFQILCTSNVRRFLTIWYREAYDAIPGSTLKKMDIIPGATHLFEESGEFCFGISFFFSFFSADQSTLRNV